ncbi:MAG TPA: hypothetical protein VK745_13665 [Polyangiaceae bacterium]|jgi:hypothetical protein|nr:hypothetical protein [Polyangiaceae bacterium]
MTARWFLVLLSLANGCAAVPTSPRLDTTPARTSVAPALAPPQSLAALPVAAPLNSAASEPPLQLALRQELAVSVSSIALGDGSRIAVLADPPYIGDARGLHALPLPGSFQPRSNENAELRIFWGRDNEPRIMGTRRSSTGEIPVYLRHTSAGWRDGRDEIGQLGSATRGGLWGVLGSADPELVCRAGAVCIIKRTSGWTLAPAGPASLIVELREGTLWGLDVHGIATIDARGWSLAVPAPTWPRPEAFWAVAAEAWVVAGGELFHYLRGAWTSARAPIAKPAAFWGSRPDSIWLVGEGGVAHFDGRVWRASSSVGSLHAIAGRSDAELWFGGDTGLFRVQQ